jgi:predicted methyltransferase
MSAVARKYIAKSVVEEMVLEYYKQGFSIHKLAELTDTPIVKVMEILRGLGEVLDDIDQELVEIENG